uniref:Uncharacterized protein n=1 Tax=Timema cristinae TaxID=61476 RepID=A0A7R9DBK5_TIMCR|nr:unnamed protein product [Timema cristinae]
MLNGINVGLGHQELICGGGVEGEEGVFPESLVDSRRDLVWSRLGRRPKGCLLVFPVVTPRLVLKEYRMVRKRVAFGKPKACANLTEGRSKIIGAATTKRVKKGCTVVHCSLSHTTSTLVPDHRSRYYQESQEGLYSGPLFLVTYYLYSLPFSIVSVAAGSRIVFQLTGLDTATEWLLFGSVLWSCHILAEQQTIALLMVIKSSFTAAVTSVYITIIYLTRYAGAFLNQHVFDNGRLNGLPYDATVNCSAVIQTQESLSASSTFVCRYGDGLAYLKERYSRDDDDTFTEILDNNLNIGATFAFSLGLLTLDCFLYLVPLPAFVKAKFRE